VWQAVESKVKDRIGFIKLLIYVVSAILSIFCGLILWLLADRDVRNVLVTKWVIDVDEKVRHSNFSLMDGYLENTNVKSTIIGLIDSRFSEAMKKILAYSYSATAVRQFCRERSVRY
jgi:hypothetical protein